jgi:uncharacterized protein YjiS (DUF1127 family)
MALPGREETCPEEGTIMTMTSISRIFQAMAHRRERRLARRAFSDMSDPMLKDLGLIRSDIEAAVNGDISWRPRRMTAAS